MSPKGWRAAGLLPLLLCASAQACRWDRDTLAEEAKGKRDLVSVIIGRFERNPALYYEMRLARVGGELKSSPKNLNLYDDAAVACDHLGRPGEAIDWIERKRKELQAIDPHRNRKDDWYRYYANAGTFWAHRAIGLSEKDQRIRQLERARDLIDAALKINPNAHFGRERFQRIAIDWLLVSTRFPSQDSGTTLGHWIARSGYQDRARAPEVVEGLAGLMRLGAAWESVDVTAALAKFCFTRHDDRLYEIACLRTHELWKDGKRSYAFETPTRLVKVIKGGEDAEREHTIKEYRRLRIEADEWHRQRTEFMLSRLKEGKHPDTHPDFWEGYQESAPPRISERPALARALNRYLGDNAMLGLGIMFVAGPLAVFGVIGLMRKSRGSASGDKVAGR